MTNDIESGRRELAGIDYDKYGINIDAALQRRKDQGLPTHTLKEHIPLAEQLLAERVEQLAVNMKAPLAPYVAAMVGIGEKLISPKGQKWHLSSWMLLTQEKYLDKFNGDLTDLLLSDTSRNIEDDKVNKIITNAADVDIFEEFYVNNSYQFYNLFLGVNLTWNSKEYQKDIGAYSCHKLMKHTNLDRLPNYVVVRPPYGYSLYSVPNSQPPKYCNWKEIAYLPEKEKVVDSVLSAYFKAEEGQSQWSVLRPDWNARGNVYYDLVIAERKPISTRKDRYDTHTKIESNPPRLNSEMAFENQLINPDQRKALADRVDQLLASQRG